jgi:heme oxygenase
MSLKSETQALHTQAEKHPFNQDLMHGKLSGTHYLYWLQCQKQLFQAIESRAIETGGLPHKSLARTFLIDQDIRSRTEKAQCISAIDRYVHHINTIHAGHVAPHIYLNYLALLFGGSMIRKRVNGTTHIFEFENAKECIEAIRIIEQDNSEWIDEVNRGYSFWIDTFDEIYKS